jgi:hypothetical protein
MPAKSLQQTSTAFSEPAVVDFFNPSASAPPAAADQVTLVAPFLSDEASLVTETITIPETACQTVGAPSVYDALPAFPS